jgi:hypothetical protein
MFAAAVVEAEVEMKHPSGKVNCGWEGDTKR